MPAKIVMTRFDPQPLSNHLVIPSDMSAARRIQEQILDKAKRLGYGERCLFAIRLALEEAFVNAHRHGNGRDPHKNLHVSHDIDDQRLVVRIGDEGRGFDPNGVPDPTSPDRIALPEGRGIMLMRAYVDDVSYNDAGNEIQLVKKRT